MIDHNELIARVRAYDPQVNADLLARAYIYGTKKHTDQKRASGDPYFIHPVEVAGILAGMRLDSATIATALLHDTIEDTSATRAEITRLFGEEVAVLVEGVTKFNKLERVSEETKRAENFKKLLLATAGDVRVLLVKLADRLHNMRTLKHLSSEEKRITIAEETISIYAPLAGRMGMQELREELEELAFRELNPRAFKMIRGRIRPLVREKGEVFHNIADEIKRKFAQHGIDADVSWRMKKTWSIWKKMEKRSISLEQVSDLMGFRIIVSDVADCYRALGIIHTTWQSVPNRFKDYISTPKPNGYQSIHSAVIGPKQQRIELQIRTQLMHECAEYGIAAHWSYKDKDTKNAVDNAPLFAWLRGVVEMLESDDSAQEFLEHTKMEMFVGYIFCFTSKGRLIVLPQGATPIDFAYAVHTDIGDHCVGARVNSRPISLRQPLQDGDEVEIIRGKKTQLSPAWEEIVKTGKARSAIRRALRVKHKQAQQNLGWEILKSIFKLHQQTLEKSLLERALGPLAQESVDLLLERVAQSKIIAQDVFDAVHPGVAKSGARNKKRWRPMNLFGRRRSDRIKIAQAKIPIRGNPAGIAMAFAEGYFPVPGDRIVGILVPEKGVQIYPLSAAALSTFEIRPERWINLDWDIDEKSATLFLTRLVIEIAHEVGALATITALVAEYQSNIDYLDLVRSDANFRTLQLDIEVRDLHHVNQILTALKGMSVVHSVKRELEPAA